MSVPVCPEDFILIKLDKKFRDTTDSGIIIDTTYRPGHYATVTGNVVSVPLGLSDHIQKRNIPMEVQVGDELAFAYRVVYNQDAIDNERDLFYEDPPVNAYVTKWSASNGLQLIRRNKGKGKFDAALFREENGKGVILDKTEGDADHVAAFISKYKPEKKVTFEYRNFFIHEGEEYCKVDYQMAYAVKKESGVKMIGGNVLLEYPLGGVDRGKAYDGMLDVFGEVRKAPKKELRAVVLAIGTPLKGQPALSVGAGDVAIVNSQTVQEYNFWGKDFLLCRQDQILAKA